MNVVLANLMKKFSVIFGSNFFHFLLIYLFIDLFLVLNNLKKDIDADTIVPILMLPSDFLKKHSLRFHRVYLSDLLCVVLKSIPLFEVFLYFHIPKT